MKKTIKFLPLVMTSLFLTSCLGIKIPSPFKTSSSEEQSSEVSSQSTQSSSSSSSSSTSHGHHISSEEESSEELSSEETSTSSNSSSTTSSSSSSESSSATTSSSETSSESSSQSSSATSSESQDPEKDAWTIMIYMCGSDLESGSTFATKDINEILSVSGQPDNVNIIIETGGANAWGTSGIKTDKLGRFHVKNQKLVKDTDITYAAMGKQSTLESFLTWGLTSYPAEKTGVIFWNHGGAMRGVCYDETTTGGDDPLITSETTGAFEKVIGDNKLEFVGYDACLMQVGDIAEKNSEYFNYMIAAEESEAGEGWAYETWLDDLYAGKSTETILKAACDGFVQAYQDTWGSQYDNDQTLSVLDLSKIGAYKEAIEDLASGVGTGIGSYGEDDFYKWARKTIKTYGSDYYEPKDLSGYGITTSNCEDYGMYYSGGYIIDPGCNYFGTFDAYDFLTKIGTKSQFSSLSTKIKTAQDAIEDVVIYNKIGGEAGESHGLCLFFPTSSDAAKATYYAASETNFTQWRSMVNTYGA